MSEYGFFEITFWPTEFAELEFLRKESKALLYKVHIYISSQVSAEVKVESLFGFSSNKKMRFIQCLK